MRYETRWSAAVVRATRNVADNVRLFEIEPEGGAEPYPAGSHLNLRVIIDGAQAERTYSLVGSRPHDGAYRIAVQRREDTRGGSRYLWALEPGARLAVSSPQNLFELRHGRPQYLVVAGGIGITPVVGMAEVLQAKGADYRLVYCGRDRAVMPFVDELVERHGDRVELFVSSEGKRLDIDAEVARLDERGELYLCGPQRLLDAARRSWQAAQRPLTGLRFETFGSSGRFAAEPFVVEVADRGGLEVEVGIGQTMLEALENHGVESMFDCRRGECGLCAVTVVDVDGEVDHRDVFLSDAEREEGRKVCTCVSRVAGGRITVDTGFRA